MLFAGDGNFWGSVKTEFGLIVLVFALRGGQSKSVKPRSLSILGSGR